MKTIPLTRRILLSALCATQLCAISTGALAQTYPAKPIRLVIPSSPGGGTDAIGRVLADALGNVLKQQVVTENRAGASGVIEPVGRVQAHSPGREPHRVNLQGGCVEHGRSTQSAIEAFPPSAEKPQPGALKPSGGGLSDHRLTTSP